ncbi:unnamed protein product [Echinostoma caproni]|uniref:CCDC66 domain-containing protein n=1 Tax=Echinostoma caproni TaxID=27848 RepID=A0A183AGG0_9TREM|nr:unnamed protein product [Echinostoma caproni]
MRKLEGCHFKEATAMELMKQLEEAHKEARIQAEKARERKKIELRQQQQQLRSARAENQVQSVQKMRPWRATNKHPEEIRRMNYFDNRSPDRVDQVRLEQKRNHSADTLLPRVGDALEFAGETLRSSMSTRRTLEKTRATQVNPMIVGPKLPWRPTSRRPERYSPTDVYETRRQFREVRGFLRRQSASAGPSKSPRVFRMVGDDGYAQGTLECDKPRRIMSAQISTLGTRAHAIRLSESEIALEDLPPPPTYFGCDETQHMPNMQSASPNQPLSIPVSASMSPNPLALLSERELQGPNAHAEANSIGLDKLPTMNIQPKPLPTDHEQRRLCISRTPPYPTEQHTSLWKQNGSMQSFKSTEPEIGTNRLNDNDEPFSTLKAVTCERPPAYTSQQSEPNSLSGDTVIPEPRPRKTTDRKPGEKYTGELNCSLQSMDNLYTNIVIEKVDLPVMQINCNSENGRTQFC